MSHKHVVQGSRRPWYEEWFDEDYQRLYRHRDLASAAREADFAVSALNLRPDERIHDLCAGDGRHLVHLLQRGYVRIFGSDLSPTQLARARRRCIRGGFAPPLVRADMRSRIATGLDAVLNLFTSFGYFESDAENNLVLRAVADSLRPGGRFLIDLANKPAVLASLTPRSERLLDGEPVIEQRWYDSVRGRVEKSITLVREEEQVTQRESVRLYDCDELTDLLRRHGMVTREVYGDFSGAGYTQLTPRLIVAAAKQE